MRTKIKATALLLCAALLTVGCKKSPNSSSSVRSTVSSQPAVSDNTSSAVSSAEPVPSSEPIASAVSEPPAESTVSKAPQPASKPETTPAQEKAAKYGAVFIAPQLNNVYLTFDLGYENGYTAKILDTLKKKNAKEIFFVTMGYCEKSPEIVARIINEGHILGNHSVSYKSFPTLTVAEMKKEIQGLHDYIKTEYGYEMLLFRPPMGEYSVRSLAVAQSLGYQRMNWSFAYKDWDTKSQPDEAAAKQKMLNDVHGGAIYLIHAVSKTNAAVLGDVIDGIRAKDFEIAELPHNS